MKYKSIYKTISYRIGSIIITMVLLRFFMDDWVQISAYTLLAHSVKMVWYFAHEKLYRYIKRRFVMKQVKKTGNLDLIIENKMEEQRDESKKIL